MIKGTETILHYITSISNRRTPLRVSIHRLKVLYDRSMNILYVNGHPYDKSFHSAIRDSYTNRLDPKHKVEVLNLGDLTFDPVLRYGYHQFMSEDADIQRSQDLVKRADHIVFTYPLWWGTPPSLMMGWIARVFTPGFSYNMKDMLHNVPHLKGKTADIIITSRAPRFMWPLVGNIGAKLLTRNLFALTGIKSRRLFVLDWMSLRRDTEHRRKHFLQKIANYSATI